MNIGGGKMNGIKIGKRFICKNKFESPYIIAEIGVNHECSLEQAKRMIEEVAKAGGNAVKFQAYKAEILASKFSPPYWDTTKETTKSQFELFKKYDKFWKKEFEELADYSRDCQVDFLTTPFNFESVDFLEPLVPAYKVASADITNKPLLKYIAKKEKPILLSTGASTISEIWSAIEWITEEGNDNIALLHCVLNYPTKYENANIGRIKYMKDHFVNYTVGYSDHTLSDKMEDVLIPAWFFGAQIIEKHYTWNKALPGNDHYHSMDYNDLNKLIKKMSFIQRIIGDCDNHCIEGENLARRYARRSLVASRRIPRGKSIEANDLTWKRPGTGIPPAMIDYVIGGIALDEINEDELLKFEKIKLKSKL